MSIHKNVWEKVLTITHTGNLETGARDGTGNQGLLSASFLVFVMVFG